MLKELIQGQEGLLVSEEKENMEEEREEVEFLCLFCLSFRCMNKGDDANIEGEEEEEEEEEVEVEEEEELGW